MNLTMKQLKALQTELLKQARRRGTPDKPGALWAFNPEWIEIRACHAIDELIQARSRDKGPKALAHAAALRLLDLTQQALLAANGNFCSQCGAPTVGNEPHAATCPYKEAYEAAEIAAVREAPHERALRLIWARKAGS